MSTATQHPAPQSAQRASARPSATRLLEILADSTAFHTDLLASIRSRREALRNADFHALSALEKSEAKLVQRMSQLDALRVAEATQLAVRLSLPARATLGQIAERFPEPERARLDLARSQLRTAIEASQRESGIVRQASERLSAHMAGVLQAVNSALAHAKVYSRGGVIAMGPNVVSSLDIKS